MNKREPIPKSTRFAVLKRDRFRCKYCGISAEEADEPLQIDHVKPVSKGGTNDIINLVASCFACNNGKRDELLTQNTEFEVQRQQIEQMQAKREQLEMMVEWREEAQKLQESQIAIVAQYWKHSTMGDPYNCCDLVHLKHLVARFGPHVVCDGIDEAISTYLRDGAKPRHEYTWQKLKRVIEVNERDKVEPGYKHKTMAIGYMIYARMIPKWACNHHNELVDFACEELGYCLENIIDDIKQSRNYAEFVDRLIGFQPGTVQSTFQDNVSDDPETIFQALVDPNSELVRLIQEQTKRHNTNIPLQTT